MLTEAIVLAAHAHEGQVDKQGEPYILHPLRVMLAGATDEERAAGVLHDVVEDTPYTLRAVARAAGREVAAAVDALSRRDGETYAEFIARASKNPLARVVKINDIRDNLARIDGMPDEDEALSLGRRYMKALEVLLPSPHLDTGTRRAC